MPFVFLSYRRADTRESALRLGDHFDRELGRRSVFLDSETIDAGTSFPKEIADALERADAMVVLIGPSWLNWDDPTASRLHEPDDFVRREIRRALERGIPVYPVLVDGASMPDPSALPHDIVRLADMQAVRLQRSSFLSDADSLTNHLRDDALFGVASWVIVACIVMALVRAAIPSVTEPTSVPNAVGRESAATTILRTAIYYVFVPGAFLLGARGFFGLTIMRAVRLAGAIALGALVGVALRVAIERSFPSAQSSDWWYWVDWTWILTWLGAVLAAAYNTRVVGADGPRRRRRVVTALCLAVAAGGTVSGVLMRLSSMGADWGIIVRSLAGESRWSIAVLVLMLALPLARRAPVKARVGFLAATVFGSLVGVLMTAGIASVISPRVAADVGITAAAISVSRVMFPLWAYVRVRRAGLLSASRSDAEHASTMRSELSAPAARG